MSARRPGRPPTEQVAEGERRARILQVATRLFGRHGYAAVSTGDIAAEVGVSGAALYHHFRSKDALYAEAMLDLLKRIAGAITAIVDDRGLGVGDRISRLVDTSLSSMPADADMDSMMRDVADHLDAARRDEVERAHREVVAAIERLMEEGLASGELRPIGDPALLAHALLQLITGFGGRRGRGAGFSPTRAAGPVAEIFRRGVERIE